MRLAPSVALALWLAACAGGPPPPAVAENVDLERYLGTWYEIESYPNRFQRGCSRTRAEYARRADGSIRVRNVCLRGGEWESALGRAWVAGEDPARLRVRFFWPFSGPYWILAVGPDYGWALVGTPDRDLLWILSRTPTLPAATRERIRELAAARGFDPSRLVPTDQVGAGAAR